MRPFKEILLLPREQIIFLLNGRCGSTSVRRMAMYDLDYDDPCDKVYRGLIYLQLDELEGYWDCRRMMMVRNPFMRAVSLFNTKAKRRYKPIDKRFDIFKKVTTFSDFIKKLADTSDEDVDPHFRSQTLYFDYVQPQTVIKLEEIRQNWPDDLPRLKNWNPSRGSNGKPYLRYYTDVTISLLQNRYARDFELLNY